MQWFDLGLCLGVPTTPLFFIENERISVHDCMREMVIYWLKANPEASWQTLIAALQRIGHYSVAKRINEKYRI